eukprot:gene4968-6189_t
MKDRTIYMSMNLVGYNVSVQLKNGAVYDGILHSTSTDKAAGWGIVLSMARKREVPPVQVVTTPPIPLLVLEAKDFVQLTASGVILDNYKDSFTPRNDGFHTDTDISGHDGVVRERELMPWNGGSDTPSNIDDSLDGLGTSKSGSSLDRWDQFEANERLYGVKTTYNEEIYTTSLDRHSDSYKDRITLVEKLANEIENKPSGNLHLAEERGQVVGTDYDEEERFSSVVRKNQPATNSSTNLSPPTGSNIHVVPSTEKYVPPSKRQQPQQQPKQTKETSGTTSPTSPPSTATSTTTTSPTPTTTTTSTTTTTTTTPPVVPPLGKPTIPILPTAAAIAANSPSRSTPNTPASTTTDSTTSTTNKETGSPNISLLRFTRDNNIDQSEINMSPRDGLSPRATLYSRVRQVIVGNKNSQLKSSGSNIPMPAAGEIPKSPMTSNAIVQDANLLSSLSLEVVTPQLPDSTLEEFTEFKLNKSTSGSNDRISQIENYKSFSRDLSIKSRSRPGSPLIGSHSPRTPSGLSSLSLSNSLSGIRTGTSDKETPESTPTKKEEKDSNITTSSTTTTTTSTPETTTTTKSTTTESVAEKSTPEKETKESTTTTTTESKSTNETTKTESSSTTTATTTTSETKLKFNPNAKPFTPTFSTGKFTFNTTANKTPSNEFGSTSEVGGRSNIDSQTPINEMYYEAMKKKHPESADSVPTYWVDPRYATEDVDNNPYQMRPPMGVPVNAIPTYYPPPIPTMKIGGKPGMYNTGQIPRGPPPYIPQGGPVPVGPGIAQHPNPYVFAQPPPYQYVPQPPPNVYNPGGGIPPPHNMSKPRYYPNTQYQQILIQPPQPPSPQQPTQIPSPNRIVPGTGLINPQFPYMTQPPPPNRGYVHDPHAYHGHPTY